MSVRKKNQALKQLTAAYEHLTMARINILTARVQYAAESPTTLGTITEIEEQAYGLGEQVSQTISLIDSELSDEQKTTAAATKVSRATPSVDDTSKKKGS